MTEAAGPAPSNPGANTAAGRLNGAGHRCAGTNVHPESSLAPSRDNRSEARA